jgi:hypothetical protein
MEYPCGTYKDESGVKYIFSIVAPILDKKTKLWECKISFTPQINDNDSSKKDNIFTGKGKDSLEAFIIAYSNFYSYIEEIDDKLTRIYSEDSEGPEPFTMMLYNTNLTDDFYERLLDEINEEACKYIYHKRLKKKSK